MQTTLSTKPRVCFVGIGNMGNPMAANLIKAGYPVAVFDLVRGKADNLIAHGATWASSLAEGAAAADVVIASLPGPDQVRAAMLGKTGILSAVCPGTTVIDTSTSAVDLVIELTKFAGTRNVDFLEAPVTNAVDFAALGRLSIFVGGSKTCFDKHKPIFEVLGEKIFHVGAPGNGATIKLTYTEALYDAEGMRGDRDLVEGRQALGIFDTFIADGSVRTFAPLWWRTWRYAELDIQTGAAPLTLEGMRVYETGYPFQKIARFNSSDPGLNRIWDVGWRTAEVDAHETYMDSSYWEQLQYQGDTRLQMLISYAVAGDPRLAQQAIESFAESDVHGGLQQGAYPSRSDNVIATFALAWVGMLNDWAMEQPDKTVIVSNLPRMRKVLDWFEPTRRPNGLLGTNPHWNFIDWVRSKNDREFFPSFGKDGGSCLMTALWLGALRQGAVLEAAHGDKHLAARDTARADAARDAIRRLCWNQERGLFADNADFSLYSQHMNALAVLYDVATPREAPAILDRITLPGKGIDAPEGMFTTTYYFAWYLIRAFEHAGMADRYLALMQTWRDLLDIHYTTWPESRGDTRSDTHAWSAHPTADLLGLVAGIRPAAPGYARLRVAPNLGDLTSLDAAAVTPKGKVSVRYVIKGDSLTAEIDCPAALPGEFVWKGKSYPLTGAHSRFVLPR